MRTADSRSGLKCRLGPKLSFCFKNRSENMRFTYRSMTQSPSPQKICFVLRHVKYVIKAVLRCISRNPCHAELRRKVGARARKGHWWSVFICIIIGPFIREKIRRVCAICRAGDIWRNVLFKFIRLCMETPCLCSFGGGTNMAARS